MDDRLRLDTILFRGYNTAMEPTHDPAVPVSVTRLARAFDLPELRSWLRHRIVTLDTPSPGGWPVITPQAAVGLLLAWAMKTAGFKLKKIRALGDLLRSAFEERDATGYMPWLVIDPPAGWVRVLVVMDGGTPSFPPPVRCLNLNALEEAFALVLERWPSGRPLPEVVESGLAGAVQEARAGLESA